MCAYYVVSLLLNEASITCVTVAASDQPGDEFLHFNGEGPARHSCEVSKKSQNQIVNSHFAKKIITSSGRQVSYSSLKIQSSNIVLLFLLRSHSSTNFFVKMRSSFYSIVAAMASLVSASAATPSRESDNNGGGFLRGIRNNLEAFAQEKS